MLSFIQFFLFNKQLHELRFILIYVLEYFLYILFYYPLLGLVLYWMKMADILNRSIHTISFTHYDIRKTIASSQVRINTSTHTIFHSPFLLYISLIPIFLLDCDSISHEFKEGVHTEFHKSFTGSIIYSLHIYWMSMTFKRRYKQVKYEWVKYVDFLWHRNFTA